MCLSAARIICFAVVFIGSPRYGDKIIVFFRIIRHLCSGCYLILLLWEAFFTFSVLLTIFHTLTKYKLAYLYYRRFTRRLQMYNEIVSWNIPHKVIVSEWRQCRWRWYEATVIDSIVWLLQRTGSDGSAARGGGAASAGRVHRVLGCGWVPPTPRVHVSVGLLSLCYPECDTTKRLLTPEREIHSLHKDKLWSNH